MALPAISGLDLSELSAYLERLPLHGKTIQQSMKAVPYFSMLNVIGDIFAAVATIADLVSYWYCMPCLAAAEGYGIAAASSCESVCTEI